MQRKMLYLAITTLPLSYKRAMGHVCVLAILSFSTSNTVYVDGCCVV